MFASTLMRGKALSWVSSDLKNNLEGEADSMTEAWVEDFDKFSIRITKMLGPSHEKENAEGIINRLRQSKSASEYAVTFQHYAAKTKWDDQSQMYAFRRGLRDQQPLPAQVVVTSYGQWGRVY